ncbi:MAG: serine hydrolase domain-containing protein [Desulfococcaceae bacterium]
MNEFSPESPGWERVDGLMEWAARSGVFPGAVLATGPAGQIRFRKAVGIADCRDGRPVEWDTVFDLASLTKPLATALAFLKLWGSGRLHPEDRLARWLPETAAMRKGQIRLFELLDHTGGFPAHRPFYRKLRGLPPLRRKAALRQWLTRVPLERPPGRKTLYSDLGFMVLEWALERAGGEPFHSRVVEEIYRPLGLGLHFPLLRPDPDLRYAATERCGWRNRMLKGEAHDENAHVCGGVSGHAGLFGTAEDVFRLLSRLFEAFRGKGQTFFGPAANVRRLLTLTGPGRRTMGFDVPGGPRPSCGDRFSRRTVGHLGFTGTSFWMDQEADRIVVLLSNRVHPSRWNQRIRRFRPVLHDAVRSAGG